MTSTNDGLRQASVRAVTGTTLDYDGDWMALFDAASIAKGNWDERFLLWLNLKLGASYTNVEAAMQAFATTLGAFNFSSIGTFSASTGGGTAALKFNLASNSMYVPVVAF
jgi:hypothetical protein